MMPLPAGLLEKLAASLPGVSMIPGTGPAAPALAPITGGPQAAPLPPHVAGAAGLAAPSMQAPGNLLPPVNLMGGMPSMPQIGGGPQAAPLPPGPAPRMNLLERVGHALSHAEGAFSNAVRPGTPAGYGQLLTPEEIASARPSLLHTLFHGENASAGQDYENNLNGIVQRKMLGVGFARQQEMQSATDAVMHANPMPTSGSADEVRAWMNRVMPGLAAAGNYPAVQALQAYADRLNTAPAEKNGALFQNDVTHEIKSFPITAGSTIPAGWSRMSGSADAGTMQVWSDGKGHYASVAPADEPKMQTLAAQGFRPDIDTRTYDVQHNEQLRSDRAYVRQSVNDFATDIKPLTSKALIINQAESIFGEALSSKDPDVRAALTGPAISQFVQAVEQSQNLRFQLLQYYKNNIDRSFKGTWDMLKARMLTGTLPDAKLRALQQIVGYTKGVVRQEIESRRAERVKRDSSLDDELPRTDTYFTSPDSGQGGFNLQDWFAKNPPAPVRK